MSTDLRSRTSVFQGFGLTIVLLACACGGGGDGGTLSSVDARFAVDAAFAVDAPFAVDAKVDAAAACDGGVVECGNLLSNGGFEQPAIAANSDVYSVSPTFLPGWTLSAGGNQFFIENGKPFGIPRYSEGNQGICLNSDGAPNVYIEQSFATTIGRSYRLSFTMTDEQVAGPSACQVQVDVAGTTMTFTRANDTGFATKELTFVAAESTTKLRLTDTTPGSSLINNPLIDAILVQPVD